MYRKNNFLFLLDRLHSQTFVCIGKLISHIHEKRTHTPWCQALPISTTTKIKYQFYVELLELFIHSLMLCCSPLSKLYILFSFYSSIIPRHSLSVSATHFFLSEPSAMFLMEIFLFDSSRQSVYPSAIFFFFLFRCEIRNSIDWLWGGTLFSRRRRRNR